MKTLLLSLALAVAFSGQTRNPNLNIETSYDRFDDITIVTLKENLIPGGIVNLGGGSVYVPHNTDYHTADFHIMGAIQGRDLNKAPFTFTLSIVSVSTEWRYLRGPNTLRLIINGDRRLTLGEMKRVSEVAKGGKVIELMTIENFSFSTIEDLAKAKKIEMQLGLDEFEMKGSQISDIQDWISRFPAAHRKPKSAP